MSTKREKLFDAFIVEHFVGDEVTGQIYWKKDYGRVKAGTKIGYIDKWHGYVRMNVPKVPFHGRAIFRAHRVLWKLATGEWPVDQIDHINGIRSDNRLSNLREATNGQNQANSPAYSNNLLGLKGVRKRGNSAKSYKAQITHGGKNWWLGSYATPEEAHAAYLRAAKNQHGEFARGV